MLSIRNIGASADAHKYYVEYAQGHGEPPGEWWGVPMSHFGAEQSVGAEEMKNMLRGFSPDGSKALSQNSGNEHRGGWDLTFSPPKSVSIVWSNAEPELRAQIESAQNAAVKSALAYINTYGAEVRVGKLGVERQKADLVAALFEHGSNRSYEPQLHTHVVVFNVAKSQVDGKWRCPESRDIYISQMAASAYYKAELASRIQGLGLQVEKSGHSFEVVGVPQAVCEAQSGRSEEIKDALEKKGLEKETASARAREIATLSTRNDKKGICRDFERWQSENASFGFGRDELLALRNNEGTSIRKEFSEDELIASSLKKLTEQDSTFDKHKIHFRLAQESIGLQDANGVATSVAKAIECENVLSLSTHEKVSEKFSTPEMVKIETRISQILLDRQNESLHSLQDKTVEHAISARPTLNDEQRRAIAYLCKDSSATGFIEGQAGTGKSFLLSVVREAYENEGFKLVGLSFTNKAAKNLESSSQIKSQSVDSFLYQAKDNRIDIGARSVLVVDEAAMLDSRKTLQLVELANAAKAKLIFVGDAKQIQPILAGQAFEAQRSLSDSRQIATVFRQKTPWEREAVQNIREGKIKEALKAFSEHDLLKLHSTRLRVYNRMIKDWSEETAKASQKSLVMIATKNAEVSTLNQLARKHLLETGRLKSGIELQTSHGKAEFSKGDKIIFTGNLKKQGIYNSVMGTIESVSKDKVLVRTEEKSLVSFDPRHFNKFRHGYAITAHKSQGSTVDRSFVLVDGFSMDKEKFYVAVSRGRENNTIYCDKSSLREMPFETRKKLKNMTVAEKREAFRDHFIKEVAAIVGVSHQKDSTQDYLKPDRQLTNTILKKFDRETWLSRSVDDFSKAYASRVNDFKHSINTMVSKFKSLINKERRAEQAQNKQHDRTR